MKIAFAGTPEFARVALEAIVAAGHDVALVLTQPDRPAGRGLKLAASPVKSFANQQNLRILQPAGLKLDGKDPKGALEAQERLVSTMPDALVVAAYGLILPQWTLDVAPALNIHASLLPRWRGAAPIQRAIESGDVETGITIMRMDAGLDTGPILLQQPVPISVEDTAESLQTRLASLGAQLIVDCLARLAYLDPVPQPALGATYAAKILRDEARLDFAVSAEEVARKVRALNPTPGAFANYHGVTVKFWRARASTSTSGAPPGAILDVAAGAVTIACASGAVEVTEIQKAGGVRLPAAEFVKGFSFDVGEVFH